MAGFSLALGARWRLGRLPCRWVARRERANRKNRQAEKRAGGLRDHGLGRFVGHRYFLVYAMDRFFPLRSRPALLVGAFACVAGLSVSLRAQTTMMSNSEPATPLP